MNHLVALSGGKDSTAMALHLTELNPKTDYKFFITPTGDELPWMENHWMNIEKLIGKKLIRLVDPNYPTIYDLVRHFKALPSFRQRWCTRILKIEPAQMFCKKMKPAVVYVGLRHDEKSRRGNKLYDENINQAFPLRDWKWGIDEVFAYLNKKNVTIPRRTDCAMCFWQRIGEWWMLWKEFPDIFQKISDLEDETGHTLMTPGKHKIWPHKLSDLAIEFKNGRRPREIKRVFSCPACSM